MDSSELKIQLKQAAEVRDRLEGYLDAALLQRIGLSEEESVYDIPYIKEKLAKISNISEALSDSQMMATKIHLSVVVQQGEARSRLRLAEEDRRDSGMYKELSREEKTPWISKELAVYRDNEESWSLTLAFSTEVRKQLTDRIQMLRRLDSDLRLHQNLLDVGHRGGVMGSPLPSGNISVGSTINLEGDEIQLG